MRNWMIRAKLLTLSLSCLLFSSDLSVTITLAQEPITCPGFIESRLVVGQTGRVTPGDANNIRAEPSRQSASIGSIPGEGVFTVLDGPICAEGFAWWQVDYEGLVGWTVEGADGEYWLEPYEACESAFNIGDEVEVLNGFSSWLAPEPDGRSSENVQLEEGAVVTLIDGPVCIGDWTWMQVRASGAIGWIPEGGVPPCDSYCSDHHQLWVRYPVKPLPVVNRADAIERVETGRTTPELAANAITVDNVNELQELTHIGDGKITDFVWSPDGRQLAVIGSVDVRIFSPRNLNAPLHIIDVHSSSPTAVLYSPDGQTLITADAAGEVFFWNPETFEQRTALKRDGGVEALALNHDSSLLAIGTTEDVSTWAMSEDAAPMLTWEFATSADELKFITTTNRVVAHLEISQDDMAVLNGDDGSILNMPSPDFLSVWTWEILEDGAYLFALGSEPIPRDMNFADEYFTTGWDLNTGEYWGRGWDLGNTDEGGLGRLTLAVNPITGDQLYGNGDKQYISYTSIDGRRHMEVAGVSALTYSPDGTLFAMGTESGAVNIYADANAGLVSTLYGISGAVLDVQFSSDGTFVAARGEDNTVRVWDVDSSNRLGTIQLTTLSTPIAVSPDDEEVFSASGIWDVASGRLLETLESPNGNDPSAIYYLSDDRLVSQFYDREASVYNFEDFRTGEILHTPDVYDGIHTPGFTHDVTTLFEGNSPSIIITNLVTGEEVQRIERYFRDASVLGLSHNYRFLAVSDYRQRTEETPESHILTVWDTTDGALLFTAELGQGYWREGQFSPDTTAVVFQNSGRVNETDPNGEYAWLTYLDLMTHEIREFGPFEYWLLNFGFNADGSLIVTGDMAGHLHFIDVTTGQEIGDINAHSDAVSWWMFSADGSRLYSFGREGVFKVWGVE